MKLKGFLSLFMVGILFGLSGPLAKLLSDSFSAYETVFVRFSIAFVIALVISLAIKNRISFKGISITTLALFAITFPISVILFVLAVFNTKVALAIFTYYIADSLTSFAIGYLRLGEKLDPFKLMGLILIFVSLVFFSNLPNNFELSLGMIFGLLSGFVNGIASYYKKIIKGKSSVMSLTILQTISGAVIGLIAILLSGSMFAQQVSIEDVGIAILYGIIFLVITYLMIYGFQNFNLNLGSIVVSSELIFGPLFAIIILNEKLTDYEIIGSILVILAIIISNIPSFQPNLRKN